MMTKIVILMILVEVIYSQLRKTNLTIKHLLYTIELNTKQKVNLEIQLRQLKPLIRSIIVMYTHQYYT